MANPIRIPGTSNLVCHSLPRLVNDVPAEKSSAIPKCRTQFRICAASGVLCGKEGPLISHDMG